jgi:hypothetical protein
MADMVDVINYALELVASQTQIETIDDGSPAANAALVVYAPTVQLVLRELDPDFARFTGALTLAVDPSQLPWWAYEYLYPPTCLRVRQVRPPASGTGALVDPYNPTPVRSNVAADIIATVLTKVILTNQQDALAVYTTSSVTEAQWDAVFAEAVARRLGNPLGLALSGRPDLAKQLLEEANQIAMTGGAVDESSMRPF